LGYVGVDGCPGGWFFVQLAASGAPEVGLAPNFLDVWQRWRTADAILVDIPIGLREAGREERRCDLEARRLLGRPRGSSVFPAPCRAALRAASRTEASRINHEITDRKLSKQSWALAPKIRQVDELLQEDPEARRVVREIHPEVLFWALNNGHSMKCSKRGRPGFDERLDVLKKCFAGTESTVETARNHFTRKHVARDDILDALAAAVSGLIAQGGTLLYLPEQFEHDETGLPMAMLYPRPWAVNAARQRAGPGEAVVGRVVWHDRLVIDPEVHHGEPCVTGTRVPVSMILGSLADGLKFAEVLETYPQLTRDDIAAALAYAAEVLRRR